MPPTVKSLGIDQIPLPQRLALVHEIWDTIVAENQHSLLSMEQRVELERRLAEDDANPNAVIPWEIVKAQALARLRK